MKFELKIKALFIALAILIILTAVVLASGCEVLKSKSTKELHDTQLSKKVQDDSSSIARHGITKTDKASTEQIEWWRTITQFPDRGDTNVTNVYPTTIIHEGGKGTKQETSKTTDSTYFSLMQRTFKASIDSMSRKLEEATKDKHVETKGIGVVTLLLILSAYFIITKGGGFLASRYTITKKSRT